MRLGGLLALALAGCGKVEIHDVAARFKLADTSWFEEEETLFVFYKVKAEQGISENTVIEIRYNTDDERVDWTPIEAFSPVHTHVAVDCGEHKLCGSTSFHVAKEPRNVELRMRYHRDGELALSSDTAFNVVRSGNPWSSRSMIVYGVFNEQNERVQWRGRNQFPALRNEEATELGLRRWFVVEDEAYGTDDLTTPSNPYGYGAGCPRDFTDAELGPVETEDRAVFDDEDLPVASSEHSAVCASSTVRDATGTFTTSALAQKNPEVRPAFTALHSPIRDATVIPFFLEPCSYTISQEHEEMQRQRLLMGDLEPLCIDDWEDPSFEDTLIEAFTDAIEAERPNGDDMVLVIGLNQDEDGLSELVESALSAVVPEELERSSPRVAGAFVFDSEGYTLTGSALGSSTLWCPASTTNIDPTDPIDASLLACAILPDDLNIDLGPFSFGFLPILPTRDEYLDFIDQYSEAQAGRMLDLTFRAPEFATTSRHVAVGDYGEVTFLNDEQISADSDDAFSYCTNDDPYIFVFSSPLLQDELFQEALAAGCESGEVPEELCSLGTLGLLPIEYLPTWHQTLGEERYELGLFWDFPFLLHMEYEAVVAGSATAFGFTVPFGLAADGEQYAGSTMWSTSEFPLDERLTQCTRFCDHPTFDSAGVYHVTDGFAETYIASCYVPDYPKVGDSGFPSDP